MVDWPNSKSVTGFLGESGSSNMMALNEALSEMKQKIAGYSPSGIYNMYETGLVDCRAQNRTIFRDCVKGLKAD